MSNDVPVELIEFFGGNPILPMLSRACNLDGVFRKVVRFDSETENVAGATIACIPVACDLDGVALLKDRIEDRLLRESRWKRAPTCSANKFKFLLPRGSVERRCAGHIFSLTWAEDMESFAFVPLREVSQP